MNYLDPAIAQYFFCAYDAAGNLFVDGYTGAGDFGLAELRAGNAICAISQLTLPFAHRETFTGTARPSPSGQAATMFSSSRSRDRKAWKSATPR